jgi:NAD(P)H-flavin reductase
MAPLPHRVAQRVRETRDSVTLVLEPLGAPLPPVRPGQFTMLYHPGVGEIAVSVSGGPARADGRIEQTVRSVGAVSRALHDAAPGTVIGARGPFGTAWNLASFDGRDVVVVAGGVGLAPLRPVIRAALAHRSGHRRLVLIAGARAPDEFLFRDELAAWTASGAIEVLTTVDRPGPGWTGAVGFVTEPLARMDLEPEATTALLCGPEPMMRFAARLLLQRGLAAADIEVSLERNMKCGVGLCGHCQLGPLLLCRDGPVVDYATAGPLLATREL